MGHRERIAQRIRRYCPEHRNALERFQRHGFGRDSHQLNEQHSAWLFDRNPFNDRSGPQLWVYPDEDEIVGQQAGIPFDLKVGERCFRGSWAIDLLVRPEYRLRGIGPVLTEVYADTNDITIGTGLTDLAYTAFLRAGWTDLGYIPLFVRPLDPGRMCRARGVHGPRVLMAIAAKPPLRLNDMASIASTLWRGVRLEPIDCFDERADALWAEVSPCYPVIARRDLRSLSWRFDALPDPGRYLRFYLTARNRARAYAVLRVGRHHGVKAGFVVDHLCAPPWMTALFAMCLKQFRSMGVAAVYWQGMHPQARRRLYPLGFIPRHSGAHMMLRVTPSCEAMPKVVYDARSWFLTDADSDADHAREI